MYIIEMKKKGFAIILVLATLVLLAMLSLTYIKLALIDRNIARNYMDNKRAKLIAQSGVDYAIARLQEDFFDTSWVTLGEQKTITITGKVETYTESAGSTYGENRDIFKVEVKDCNSMINVNDGLENERVTANTKRILNLLGDIVDIDKAKLGWGATEGLGDKIIEKRGYGYISKQELLKVVNNNVDEFKKFKDHVTTHSWQDPNVANPVPLSPAVLEKYTEFNDGYTNYDATIGVYRYGRGKNRSQALIAGDLMFAPDYVGPVVGLFKNVATATEYAKYGIYALDELNPQWIELVSRSPVDINHADEKIIKVLLKDLRGIFVSERRSMMPKFFRPYLNVYFHDYDPSAWGRSCLDELGFLYSTQPINYDITLDQGPAKDIASHITGCRDKKAVTTGSVTVDYTDAGSLWFRGLFKSWRQFNAFVDNLVQSGLIQDVRELSEYELYPDTDSSGGFTMWDYDELILASSSSPVRKIASQAIADCLKANFNPNLHLNELNPDANIKTLVDKTDLIINSTEFCFTPMGYFEIESEGFILRPNGMDNTVIANSKIDALVKLYDCYRETNQRQFLNHINNLTDYNNYIGTNSTPTRTNNMRTIQIGPEPDHIFNGASPLAKENEWGGYISLPTLKGPGSDTNITFFSNFTNDFSADYHAYGLNSSITTYNSADPTELKPGGVAEPAGKGPYVYDTRNRLARSFRKGDTIIPKYYAVSDLRIDGAYIERHASVVYELGSISSVLKSPGFWSYWVKPWFHPESTGKPRTFVSHSSIPGPDSTHDVYYFANWFFASHAVKEEYETNAPTYACQHPTLLAMGKYFYKSMSLVFGYSTVSNDDKKGTITGSGRGISTPILNHSYHSDNRPYYIKSGHWTHVICKWDIASTSSSEQIKILVNGKELTNFPLKPDHPTSATIPIDSFFNASKLIRLGEPSISGSVPSPYDYQRNWTCDATLDEFYIFSGTDLDLTKAKNIYFSSRYYKLAPSPSYFISQGLQLERNKIPSYSTIIDPAGFTSPTGDLVDQKSKITGLSWTWYPEEVVKNLTVTQTVKGKKITTDYRGKPILKDYKDYEKTQSTDPLTLSSTFLFPEVKINMRKNAEPPIVCADDGFTQTNIDLTSADQIKYEVIINVTGIDPVNSVLLYSPVFDDITIYYTNGIEFLSYSYFN